MVSGSRLFVLPYFAQLQPLKAQKGRGVPPQPQEQVFFALVEPGFVRAGVTTRWRPLDAVFVELEERVLCGA